MGGRLFMAIIAPVTFAFRETAVVIVKPGFILSDTSFASF